MSIKKIFFSILSLLFLVQTYVNAGPVMASPTPSFTMCTAPQGELKVKYDTGIHGIVGSSEEHTGSDAVYHVSSDTLTQCFCPPQGMGIQTNWWKATNLTQDDINVLKNDGWFYIPNGALWGLDPAPYMAANSAFTCNGGSGSGQSNGTSTGVTQSAQAFLTNATGTITGLGGTGTMEAILLFLGLGVFLLLTGIVLRKGQK